MTKPSVHDIYKNHNVFGNEIQVSIIQQYLRASKEWKFFGYRCLHCDSPFKKVSGVEKHKSICKEINTIKKEKEMPIQVVTKNGERYYRYGDSGKLYKDRKDAEKQAAAIFASGYKEPKKDMKGK